MYIYLISICKTIIKFVFPNKIVGSIFYKLLVFDHQEPPGLTEYKGSLVNVQYG